MLKPVNTPFKVSDGGSCQLKTKDLDDISLAIMLNGATDGAIHKQMNCRILV